MAYPDFSEFSFGYAVVRQIEQEMLGQQAVPVFPTQHQEADAGYDVSFLSHGVPLFIQFKRSEVMRRANCREFKDTAASWTLPVYRMHLHRAEQYRQHMLMRTLQREGKVAVYCTSGVATKAQLDDLYAAGRVLEAATVFWPLDVNLPSLYEPHHVAFMPGHSRAYVYSDTGIPFEMSGSTFRDVFAKLRPRADESVDAELQPLRQFVSEALDGRLDRLAEEERDAATEGSSDAGDTSPEPVRSTGGPFPGQAPEPTYWIEGEGSAEAGRQERRERIRQIDSVVKKAALLAYYEMDAFLVSVSKEALRR